jgi:hypothetical protein
VNHEGQAQLPLTALSDADAAELLALYHAAVQQQRAAMKTAQEQSLRLVPALLRGPVRKILGG